MSREVHLLPLCICFLSIGRRVGYVPSADSLAAANKDKLKHIRNSTLKNGGQRNPSIACILEFEKQATKHDRQMKEAAGEHEGILV